MSLSAATPVRFAAARAIHPLPPVPLAAAPTELREASAKEVAHSITLPCMHRFHKRCLQTWMTSPGSRCPVCRRQVPLNILARNTETIDTSAADVASAMFRALSDATQRDTAQLAGGGPEAGGGRQLHFSPALLLKRYSKRGCPTSSLFCACAQAR